MSSPTIADPNRAEINRRNAQSSTGPRTEEGKQRVRLNAVRHGLYSTQTVLPGEDVEAYKALGQMLYAALAPSTDYERQLIQSIHDTDWQIARLRGLESTYYTLNMLRELALVEAGDGSADPGLRRALGDAPSLDEADSPVVNALAAAVGWEKHARQFDQLSRHLGRLSRLREKALAEFLAIADARRQLQHQAADQDEDQDEMAPPEPPSSHDDGFDPAEAFSGTREFRQPARRRVQNITVTHIEDVDDDFSGDEDLSEAA